MNILLVSCVILIVLIQSCKFSNERENKKQINDNKNCLTNKFIKWNEIKKYSFDFNN